MRTSRGERPDGWMDMQMNGAHGRGLRTAVGRDLEIRSNTDHSRSRHEYGSVATSFIRRHSAGLLAK